MIKSIQIGDGDLVDSIDHPRITSGHRVEPAAPPFAPRCCAKLASKVMKCLSQFAFLGGQRSLAHARGVRLEHAYHAVQPMRRYARAGACAARCCIRGRHIRIGAMVDIEERSLCTFKQDLFVPLDGVMEIDNRVCYEGTQFFASGQVSFVDLPKTDWLRAEGLEDSVVLDHLRLQFFREYNRLHQVGHAQARSRCFVTIGRADSPLRRSNAASTQLALLVEYPVIRQDKVSAIADEQVLVDLDSQFAQTVNLTDQRYWLDNNAISNHAGCAASQNSGRRCRQTIFDAAIG